MIFFAELQAPEFRPTQKATRPAKGQAKACGWVDKQEPMKM